MKNFARSKILPCFVLALFFTASSCKKDPISAGGGGSGGGGIPILENHDGDVLTYHNDKERTGQYLNESILNAGTVGSSGFGKIGALPVDGVVYAQPLVLGKLVFVATEHDSVYAFNTETLSPTPVWKRSFLGDSVLKCNGGSDPLTNDCHTVTAQAVKAPNIYPEIGITATPVIDASNKTIYFTAMTREVTTIHWKIHALDTTTGAEKIGSPKEIYASIPGKGSGTDGTNIPFSPSTQLSRAGLVLDHGRVYVAFSSFNDNEPTHGWVFAYDQYLSPLSAWMTTPDSGDGTIWESGGAPAVDNAGHLFFSTGNGDKDWNVSSALNNYVSDPQSCPVNKKTASTNPYSVIDFADSILKLTFDGNNLGLNTTGTRDFFTPYNHTSLAVQDVDVGSGGVTNLPDSAGSAEHPHLLIAGGKQGTVYLLDRDNLGGVSPAVDGDPQAVQAYTGYIKGGKNFGPGIYGTTSYFNGRVYIGANGDVVKSIPISNAKLGWDQLKQADASTLIKLRGVTTSISASGSSNGLVWYIDPSNYSYNGWNLASGTMNVKNGPGVLYALDAESLAVIYKSTNNVNDGACGAVKFAVPTISNGKVFVGTQTELSVYGMIDSAHPRSGPPTCTF